MTILSEKLLKALRLANKAAYNIAFGYEGTDEIASNEMEAKSKIEKKWWQFWK
jgi:hypothetical protein